MKLIFLKDSLLTLRQIIDLPIVKLISTVAFRSRFIDEEIAMNSSGVYESIYTTLQF